MTVARFYILNASEGKDADLQAALSILADAVRPTPGCEGIEMVRDSESQRRFYAVEKWETADAHKNAREVLGEEDYARVHAAFAPVLALRDGRPEGCYLDCLRSI